jgi:predicted nucleotidyltransferase
MSEHFAEYETALSCLADALDAVDDYAVIGELALAFRGIPRTTRDIDVLLAVPRIQMPGVLERLQEFGSTLDVTEVFTELRDEHLSQIRHGSIRIDLMSAVLDIFVDIVKSAQREDIRGRRLRVASAEGLVLLKLIAFRPQDQADLAGLLATNKDTIDIDRIREWYSRVGETTDARWQALLRMRTEVGG